MEEGWNITGERQVKTLTGLHVVLFLPPPYTNEADDKKLANSKDVLFLGPSAIFLKPIWFSGSTRENGDGDDAAVRAEAVQEFDLTYVPLLKGFSRIGGLRVILVEDRLVDEDETALNDPEPFNVDSTIVRKSTEVRIMKEWDVIGEIWVKT